VQRPIFLETTVVPDDWIKDVDVATKLGLLRRKRTWVILFLSEVLSEKGVYVAIDATRILQMKARNVQLIIAGDGNDLADAQAYVRRTMTKDVTFCGYVSGNTKRRLFQQADILCLPTMLNEGLPIAVVEAMCFGLPVVTRAAGGLKDLFEKTMFGGITESKDSVAIAEQIDRLIRDGDLYARVAWNNYIYCRNNCLASGGSARLRRIYNLISIPRRYGCS
jgi:glycosyltransferase involved in cell wall biosynthesis